MLAQFYSKETKAVCDQSKLVGQREMKSGFQFHLRWGHAVDPEIKSVVRVKWLKQSFEKFDGSMGSLAWSSVLGVKSRLDVIITHDKNNAQLTAFPAIK